MLFSSYAHSLVLKIDATYSFETLVDFTGLHPEDRTFHDHRIENLKIVMSSIYCTVNRVNMH
jgi:hypothetical protein